MYMVTVPIYCNKDGKAIYHYFSWDCSFLSSWVAICLYGIHFGLGGEINVQIPCPRPEHRPRESPGGCKIQL